jgi:choice-of-anchor C domain-containing protein
MRVKNRLIVGVAFATALLAGAAVPLGGAQSATITNGSFEGSGDIGNFQTVNAPDPLTIPGWTVASGSVDWIQNYWISADGFRSLDMNGLAPGSITQTINGLTNGWTYQVSFELSGNPAGGPADKTLSLTAGVDTSPYTFTIGSNSLGAMGWVPESFFFKATGPSELLSFTSTTTGDSGNSTYPTAFGPALDNVSISVSQTPLPSTWLMLLSGFVGLGFLAFRGTKKGAVAIAAA